MTRTSHPGSQKAARFQESVIREMTRLAAQYDAINLAQGFPNFPAPQAVKDAACQAIQDDVNQYAITWGAPNFRRVIADKYGRFYDWEVDPEREITVACGATECMVASILALVDPGDRVVIFEPFYENYGPDSIIAGARPVFVPLHPESGWSVNFEQLEDKLRRLESEGGVRALILNSPNNPSGKVFSLAELERMADLAKRYDFLVITGEIYEHIIYDGHRHHCLAQLPGMKERTVTISGLSKTFSVTGWRVGYILAEEQMTSSIRKMHDFLTVGAAAPLQEAGVQALRLADAYYDRLATNYCERRDFLVAALKEAGFQVFIPSGAYYIMVDISPVTSLRDTEFVELLVRKYGIAAVPGSSFYRDPERGKNFVRFAFCKTLDVLEAAGQRLRRMREG